MKDKIKIIFLTSTVMTETRWYAREMDYFKKSSDIEIHELCDFLRPEARKVFKDTYKDEKIFTFKTFIDWKNHILNLQKECIKEKIKLVILTELSKYPWQGINLKYLLVNKFLKKLQIDFYEFYDTGMIPSKASVKTYSKYIKIFKYWRYLLVRINEMLTSFVGALLDFKPKGIFIAGNETKKEFENIKKSKNIELINFNSWEFSSTLNKQNNEVNLFNRKYAVFINRPGPIIKTEELHLNKIPPDETSEKWYPALDNFFSYLEKIFKLEIVIASHPKSNEEGPIDYLGNRTAILGKTEELIRGSEFVIGKNSTALTFAIVYKKPVIFIYSNETKKNIVTINAINSLSDYFRTKSINIEEEINENQIKSLINFDKKLYENYKTDFLASNPKNQNYKIVLDYLNK